MGKSVKTAAAAVVKGEKTQVASVVDVDFPYARLCPDPLSYLESTASNT